MPQQSRDENQRAPTSNLEALDLPINPAASWQLPSDIEKDKHEI